MSSGTHNMPSLANAEISLPRHRKVVLVIDLVESVSMMQADELGVITRWQAFMAHVNQFILPTNEGRLVKSLGDGLMVEFNVARQAAAAAFAMHSWMRTQCAPVRGGTLLQLRAGMHLADIYIGQQDVYGSGVNLAARVATLAGPGQTIVTTEVSEQLVAGLDADVEDLGERYLKHLQEPVRAYRVEVVGPRQSPAHRPPVTLAQPAIAVIPFEARSTAPEQWAIGDLIADGVITQLARTELQVLSRLSSAAFKGRTTSTGEIETHLGVSYALSGSYYVNGSEFVVTAELADLRNGRILWTDRWNASLGDLLQRESELIGALAAGAHGAIVKSELRYVATQPPEALADYSLLLGGVSLMHRQSRGDFVRAKVLLEHLIDRQPRFGLPRAWLGKWYALGAAQGWLGDAGKEAKRALHEVDRALEADGSLSLAMTIRGLIHGYVLKDFDASESAYQAALAENANESLAWLYMATLNSWKGRGEDAKSAAQQALALSPLDPSRYYYESLAATAFFAATDYAGAVALAERSLKANCLHTSTHKTLIVASVMNGNVERARQVASALLQMEPGFTLEQFRHRSPMIDSPQLPAILDSMLIAGIPPR